MGKGSTAGGGALLFTNFLKGYMDGSRQANQDRMDKARGLMDIAAKQAEIIDTSPNPQARAYAHKTMMQVMQDAEKAIKPDPGFFGWVKGAFGKKGKDGDLVDPIEQYGLSGIAPYGTESKEMPLSSVANARQASADSTQQALAGAAITTGLAAPPTTAQPQQPPTSRPAETGALAQGLAPVPTRELPAPRPPTVAVQFPRRATIGAVPPTEATGKGPEKVQLGPDHYDYRIDGVQVSPREYRGYILRMAERTGDLGIRGRELEQTSAQALKDREAIQKQEQTFTAQKVENLKNSPWYQGEIASGNPERIRAANDALAMIQNPGLKIENPNYEIREVLLPPDQNTGMRRRRFQVVSKQTGLPTGQVAMPDMDEPLDAMGMTIKGLLDEGKTKDPNYTYDRAVGAYGKIILEDQRIAQRVKLMALKDDNLNRKLKEIELKVKEQQADPDRRWVAQAYEDVFRAVLGSARVEQETAASAGEVAEKVFEETAFIMQKRFGVSWEEFLRKNGRDPEALKEQIKQAYLNRLSARQQEGGAAGAASGKTITSGLGVTP